MKVALVHDYIKEFGGAERVLRVLADMYPEAPIYTAFKVDGSSCEKEFRNRRIIESKLAFIIKHFNLYSPLRFLIPLIWGTMDLSEYDLVITSCSSYIARGFKVGQKTKVVAYCHTPPRFLYGYETSIDLQKYWPVKVYAVVVNHFLRIFDLLSAQRVDKWVVNSENVQRRVEKFYRKDSEVIYPPVEVEEIYEKSRTQKKENFFLIVSRLVGAKGLIESALAAKALGFKLKIVGETVGYSRIKDELEKIEGVDLLGRVSDQELYKYYAKAKGFIALAKDEDFGMTVVEAQSAGTPIIAYDGGGFRETVVDGVTGVLVDGTDEKTIEKAMSRFEKIAWSKDKLISNARRFSRESFVRNFNKVVDKIVLK